MELMSVDDMIEKAHQCILFRKRPPLQTWLSNKSHTKEESERLKSLGNVVIPQMANLGINVLLAKH